MLDVKKVKKKKLKALYKVPSSLITFVFELIYNDVYYETFM